MASEKDGGGGGGLSLQTLVISAAAAVAAAVLVPAITGGRGTLIATALTPVIVAVVSEALRHPAQRITAATPRVTRRVATGAAVRRPTADDVGARGEGPERFEPVPGGGNGISAEDPFGLREAHEPRRRRPHWLRIGIATGLLAFFIGGGVVIASELAVFGSSITGDGRTSFSGGGGSSSDDEEASPTATPSEEEEASPTPSAEATASPSPSTSPEASPTVSPAPQTTAVPTTTAPPAATPAPTP
jgi:hypothetical protein